MIFFYPSRKILNFGNYKINEMSLLLINKNCTYKFIYYGCRYKYYLIFSRLFHEILKRIHSLIILISADFARPR